MNETESRAAPRSEPGVIAWSVSTVFHVSLFFLLAMAIHDIPNRGSDFAGDSSGIVVEMDSAGDPYDGDDGRGDSADSVELVSPSETIASRLKESPPAELPIDASSLPIAEQASATVPQQAAPRAPTPARPTTTAATAVNALGSANVLSSKEGRSGTPGGRGYARVRVFGVEGKGNKFVYVFDRSASMEGPPLAAAKRQLIESLGSLSGIHQFHIIFFNHRLQGFDITGGGKRIAFASDRNKQLAANFVGGITAEGGTDRFAALKAALAFRPDAIFFLTDADDPMPPSELAEVELGSQRSGSAICVIEFGRQPAPENGNFLQALARKTGGQYGYVNTTRLTAAVR